MRPRRSGRPAQRGGHRNADGRRRTRRAAPLAALALLLLSAPPAACEECNICLGADDGFLQIPGTDCAEFARCEDGAVDEVFNCQAGLIYDSTLGQCNWAGTVTCGPDPACPTVPPTLMPSALPTEGPTADGEEGGDDDEVVRPGSASASEEEYPECPESNQCYNPRYEDCFHETAKECMEMKQPGYEAVFTKEKPDKPDKPKDDLIGFKPGEDSTVRPPVIIERRWDGIIVGDDGKVRLVPLRPPHHAAVWAHLNANKLPISSQLLRVSHRMSTVKSGRGNGDALRDYMYVDFHRAIRYMSERGYAVPVNEEGEPIQASLEEGRQVDYARSSFYLGSSDEKDAGRGGATVGLVNIALFLSQSLADSIASGSCDELNEEVVDGFLPASNSCGQYGMSYQDMECGADEAYMQCKPFPEMESVAGPNPTGNVDPFYCGSTARYPFTGEATVTSGRGAVNEPLTNADGRTDVENCCWWGRGTISTRGICQYGKLNYYLGARAAAEGRPARFPSVDFCVDPGAVCSPNPADSEVEWISGLFRWVEDVQKYDDGNGWSYLERLHFFVAGGMVDGLFVNEVSSIVTQGCPSAPCPSAVGTGMDLSDASERWSNFVQVIEALGLTIRAN